MDATQTENGRIRIAFTLDNGLVKLLGVHAAMEHLSRSELLERILQEVLEANEITQPLAAGWNEA